MQVQKRQGLSPPGAWIISRILSMAHTFTGQELFDLVWSEPTRTVAKRLGIADVGLAKACRRRTQLCNL